MATGSSRCRCYEFVLTFMPESGIIPYNAEYILYNSWRPKGFN